MKLIDVRKGLLAIEGGPGVGKTTFKDRFLAENPEFRYFREPGGTEYGERVRSAVQDRNGYSVDPLAALFGYNSSRANLMGVEVIPALNKGENIFLDRYWFSTYAYQGAEGVPKKYILASSLVATRGVIPRNVLYLDLDPRIGQARKNGQDYIDRYDVAGLGFLDKVRANYLQLGILLRPIWHTIDASQSAEQIYQNGMDILKRQGIVPARYSIQNPGIPINTLDK